MFTCFTKSADACKKKTDVILNAGLKTAMPCLLVVKTGGCKFDESGIDIFFAAFREAKVFQQNAVIAMKLTLQSMINTSVELMCRFPIYSECFSIPCRCFLYNRTV